MLDIAEKGLKLSGEGKVEKTDFAVSVTLTHSFTVCLIFQHTGDKKYSGFRFRTRRDGKTLVSDSVCLLELLFFGYKCTA